MDKLDWKDGARVVTLLAALVTMWWQLDSKLTWEIHALDERLTSRIDAMDNKIDRLNTLLTENLIALNREVGELKGTSHTHDTRDVGL